MHAAYLGLKLLCLHVLEASYVLEESSARKTLARLQ